MRAGCSSSSSRSAAHHVLLKHLPDSALNEHTSAPGSAVVWLRSTWDAGDGPAPFGTERRHSAVGMTRHSIATQQQAVSSTTRLLLLLPLLLLLAPQERPPRRHPSWMVWSRHGGLPGGKERHWRAACTPAESPVHVFVCPRHPAESCLGAVP